MNMNTIAAGAAGWKSGSGAAAAGAGLIAVGVAGALIMAAVDPPKTKRGLFLQASVAGVSSLVFGPLAVQLVDRWVDFVNLATAAPREYLEWAAPVYFLVGALSWGAMGMLVALRKMIAERGAAAVAQKVGVQPGGNEQ